MIETDARKEQQIPDNWQVVQAQCSDICAMIFFPDNNQIGQHYVYSIYTKHEGLSFGFFFKRGGSWPRLDSGIVALAPRDRNEVIYLSLNAPQIKYIQEGNRATYEIEPGHPFTIVSSSDEQISFIDTQGKGVEPTISYLSSL